MRYVGQILLLAPFIVAAALPPARPLPVPPIPPTWPTTEEPAPVPDLDAAPPPPRLTTGPTIKPRLLQVPTYQNAFDASAGYVNGSRLQEDQTDRRFMPSPGFSLQIPLH